MYYLGIILLVIVCIAAVAGCGFGIFIGVKKCWVKIKEYNFDSGGDGDDVHIEMTTE